ncbi:MAG: hypothetical protein HOL51_13980, partial [Gemmatimonadetes bacterium]|nr:hypothetical protein [Gemmatimonadota bacterium]MBT7588484.1 hypothetical protein [Gemmatimonadota bacterium]
MKSISVASLITVLIFCGSSTAQEREITTVDHTSPNTQIDRKIDHDLEDRLLDAISAIKGERVNMEDVVQIEAVLREAGQDSGETEQEFELRLMDAV